MCLCFFCSGGAQEHGNGCAANDGVTYPAEPVRNLSEYDEAQKRREGNLEVVENGNFPCGRVAVSGSDGELTAGSRKTCQKKCAKLHPSHRVEIENQEGQQHHAGECREEEHDKWSGNSLLSQRADIGIRKTCAKTAHKPDESRNKIHIACGFDNEQNTNEGGDDGQCLEAVRLFFQQEDGKDNRKEGRHFIEHGCVCQHQMVYGVEVAQNTHGACQCPPEQMQFGFGGKSYFGAFPIQNHSGKNQSYEITEKAFLHRGQVAGKPHKQIHQSEKEG